MIDNPNQNQMKRRPMLNYCRSCSTDFASVKAFDLHRVGTHDYTHNEGLALSQPRKDGRRCLEAAEMLDVGLELDPRGRWRVSLSDQESARLRQLTDGRTVSRSGRTGSTEGRRKIRGRAGRHPARRVASVTTPSSRSRRGIAVPQTDRTRTGVQ